MSSLQRKILPVVGYQPQIFTIKFFWFMVVPKWHSLWLSYLYNNHTFMHHYIIVATQVVTGQMVLNVTLYMQLTSLQNWSVCLIYRISVLELYPYYPGSYIPGNCYWQNKQLCFLWNINKPLECCDRSMVFDATCSMCSLLALPHHVGSFGRWKCDRSGREICSEIVWGLQQSCAGCKWHTTWSPQTSAEAS